MIALNTSPTPQAEALFPTFTAEDATRPITVLSHGLGQDSTALNLLAAYSDSFRNRFITGDLIAVHGATENEHAETYAFLPLMRAFCEKWAIPFFYLHGSLGYHTGDWARGLAAQYEAHDSIGMMTTRSCTDSLKISPIYKFIDEYIGRRYQFVWGKKKALRSYFAKFGKLPVLIGFSADESQRVATNNQLALDLGRHNKKDKSPAWMRDCVDRRYPLIDLNMNRAACQAYIRDAGFTVPVPSNCRFCHFANPEELLWKSITIPDDFAHWQRLEANKVAKHAGRLGEDGKPAANNGVKGAKMLGQIVTETRLKYAHLSDAELRAFLDDYRMSHGHCVSTSY